MFSNDGPLGAIIQKACAMPSGFHGCWTDLTWIGGEYVTASPGFTGLLVTLLKPLGYAKFSCPIVFFVLGLSAWLCFRRFKLAPMACILGGLAAALDGDFFSTGCWGVVAQPVCFAANYLALAALADLSGRRSWAKVVLAGFAIGLGVMEGFDIGAIFSLFVSLFVVFQSWNVEDGRPAGTKVSLGFVRLGVVALCAGFIAIQTVDSLIKTQIKGVVGTAQDEQTKQQRWGEATMWSVPKIEGLGLFVPGLFGYRMDTPGGANYWGAIGQQWIVPELQKQLSSPDENARAQAASFLGNASVWRFSGSGIYAGVLVVVIALWAIARSFQSRGSPFSLVQRRAIWFWAAIALVGLLMGFGKYAPFFALFYALPYASTMRNPFKFMHVLHWALIILFAYGLHGIFRAYMQNSVVRAQGVLAQFRAWRAKAPVFDRIWLNLCMAAVAAGGFGLVIYASSRSGLESYLQANAVDRALVPSVALFSILAVVWFLVFLVLTVIVLGLIFSGQFSGARANWGAVLLGIILVGDLGRSDWLWVKPWNYPYKYASNSIIDFLREKPYEYRVSVPRLPWSDDKFGLFQGVYGIEWTQQLFLYYNIQCLDVIMEPRETVDNNAFRRVISANNPATLGRHWQLTNTRYLFVPAKGGVDALNQYFDPVQRRFKVVRRFDVVPKPNIPDGRQPQEYADFTVRENPEGAVAMVDFTGALPRAKLYSNWQVNTNRDTTLSTLAEPSFDPLQTVIVGDPIAAPEPANTNQDAGMVQILPNYEPKRIEMTADVKVSSVLLLNDKYSPNWHVSVDGKTTDLLRCNFLMRGVSLSPGHHDVVFQYMVSDTPLHISLLAVIIGLGLCAFLAVDSCSARPNERSTAEAPATAAAGQAK